MYLNVEKLYSLDMENSVYKIFADGEFIKRDEFNDSTYQYDDLSFDTYADAAYYFFKEFNPYAFKVVEVVEFGVDTEIEKSRRTIYMDKW